MIVITTHVNADFDCLGSMAAAVKLHPGAVIVFSGSQEKNVRDYLASAGHFLPIAKLKTVETQKISTLVVVDSSSKDRLGPFKGIVGSSGVATVLYDHHPQTHKDILNAEEHVRERGSCSTVMVEILREKGMTVTPEEATLLMLGIYEDTGSLTFASTCSQDFVAAGWLFENGADLNIVSDYLRRGLGREQTEMLHELQELIEFVQINGVEIAAVFTASKKYIGDLSLVVQSLREIENANAMFIAVEMEGRIQLIARSRIPAVDAGGIAYAFGGGGHHTAASAVVRGMLMSEFREKLFAELKKSIPPSPTAGDMMVSPFVSVIRGTTIEEAEKLMTRNSFNALPVVEGGIPVGIITRNIVEKSLYHGLGPEKTEDYMISDFSTATLAEQYERIKEIIIKQKQKIVPVVDNAGKMLGLIGRGDVMHAIYGDMMKAHAGFPRSEQRPLKPVFRDLSGIMRDRLPDDVRKTLGQIAECATEMGCVAYAVGGFARDLILRRGNYDLDVVIEGDGIAFAENFARKYGGRVRPHRAFSTAIIALGPRRKIDVATARTEYYTEPAALPIVEMSSIKNDMYRRDFTINALAIKLNDENKNRLLDFFGGQQDIKDGVIRVLHNLSFVEDPTRIFRAIRFERRFHMSIAPQSEKLMKLAIENRLVDKVSGSRLLGELLLIFNEEQPTRALARMEEYGLWRFIHPSLKFDEKALSLCGHAEEAIAWRRLTGDGRTFRPWMVYLLCISSALSEQQAGELMERLGFMKAPIARFVKAKGIVADIAASIEKTPPSTPGDIFETFRGLEDDALIAVMAFVRDVDLKKMVVNYMTHLRQVETSITGTDLIAAGIERGPILGKILDVVKKEKINGLLANKDDEMRFAKAYYGKLTKAATNPEFSR